MNDCHVCITNVFESLNKLSDTKYQRKYTQAQSSLCLCRLTILRSLKKIFFFIYSSFNLIKSIVKVLLTSWKPDTKASVDKHILAVRYKKIFFRQKIISFRRAEKIVLLFEGLDFFEKYRNSFLWVADLFGWVN